MCDSCFLGLIAENVGKELKCPICNRVVVERVTDDTLHRLDGIVQYGRGPPFERLTCTPVPKAPTVDGGRRDDQRREPPEVHVGGGNGVPRRPTWMNDQHYNEWRRIGTTTTEDDERTTVIATSSNQQAAVATSHHTDPIRRFNS
jgi:hypothetical protein